MDEFRARQLAQIRFCISDFRDEKISLNTMLTKLEGAARAVGQEFWEQYVFDRVVDLEQINADVLEERRALTSSERIQVESLLALLENQLNQEG